MAGIKDDFKKLQFAVGEPLYDQDKPPISRYGMVIYLSAIKPETGDPTVLEMMKVLLRSHFQDDPHFFVKFE